MGDDRENSEDSRWWGCMPEQNLAGKAFLIWDELEGLGHWWRGFLAHRHDHPLSGRLPLPGGET
ncbi:S26 family signal peptidase [Rhodanobacter lindaniclasticus]